MYPQAIPCFALPILGFSINTIIFSIFSDGLLFCSVLCLNNTYIHTWIGVVFHLFLLLYIYTILYLFNLLLIYNLINSKFCFFNLLRIMLLGILLVCQLVHSCMRFPIFCFELTFCIFLYKNFVYIIRYISLLPS